MNPPHTPYRGNSPSLRYEVRKNLPSAVNSKTMLDDVKELLTHYTSMGSMRDARRAGRNAATSEVAINAATLMTYNRGSRALTPKS